MKLFQTIFLAAVCFLNIGWMWQKTSKADMYIQKGHQAWRQGNLTEAMVNYENALLFNPKSAETFNILGVIYEEVGQPAKAEQKYLMAIKLNHKFLPAYYNLGILFWNQGDLPGAVYYFRKRVELGGPSDPWTIKAQKALKNIKAKQDTDRQALISQVLDKVDDNP